MRSAYLKQALISARARPCRGDYSAQLIGELRGATTLKFRDLSGTSELLAIGSGCDGLCARRLPRLAAARVLPIRSVEALSCRARSSVGGLYGDAEPHYRPTLTTVSTTDARPSTLPRAPACS